MAGPTTVYVVIKYANSGDKVIPEIALVTLNAQLAQDAKADNYHSIVLECVEATP